MGDFDAGGNEFLDKGSTVTRKKNYRQYYRNQQPDT